MTEISREVKDGMVVTTESNLDAARQQVIRQSGMFGVPDFILVGVRYGDGVTLFASTDLTEAQLKREVARIQQVEVAPHMIARVPVEKTTVTAQLKTFTVIHADDYPSALASLQDLWNRKSSPGDSGLPAISR